MGKNGDSGTKHLIRLQPRSFKILWSYESNFPHSDPCSPKKYTWICWGQAPHLTTGQRYGGGTQNHYYSMNVDFVKILWWFNGIFTEIYLNGICKQHLWLMAASANWVSSQNGYLISYLRKGHDGEPSKFWGRLFSDNFQVIPGWVGETDPNRPHIMQSSCVTLNVSVRNVGWNSNLRHLG